MFTELTTLYTLVLATLFVCAIYLRHLDEHKFLVSRGQYKVLMELGVAALIPLGFSAFVSIRGADHSYGISLVLISLIPLWNICFSLVILSQDKKRHRAFTTNKSWFWGLLMVTAVVVIYQASEIFGGLIDTSDILLFSGCLLADVGMLAATAPVYRRSVSTQPAY